MTEERKSQLLKEAISYLGGVINDDRDLQVVLQDSLHMTEAEQQELGCPERRPCSQTNAAVRQKAEDHPRLNDLLSIRWEDIHLVHHEIENEPSTIVELSDQTLTDAGKEAWADILNAKVNRIFEGFYGLQMELSDVKARRLDEFSAMLAGYCSVEDYEKWVVQDESEHAQAQEIPMQGGVV